MGVFFFDFGVIRAASGAVPERTDESLRTVLYDGGARPGGSWRPADVVGVSWDASLVVPSLERRGGGGGGARTPSRRRASPATPSRRRQYDGVAVEAASTATPSPRKDVEHRTHRLISTQVRHRLPLPERPDCDGLR